MPAPKDQFFTALTAAGLPPVPDEFSVVPLPQAIPETALEEIKTFIRTFERITTRPGWQEAAIAAAPAIARHKRTEVCFFSAWDFHLPPGGSPQVIEFNDNGSGLLFAGLINDLYYQFFKLSQDSALQPPPAYAALTQQIIAYVRQEAGAFFGRLPPGLFLILEDAEAVQTGKFRREMDLLRDLFRRQGWQADIATPGALNWQGRQLSWQGRKVSFMVNRSTDFLWRSEAFSSLRAAYEAGQVYVAPNPFTYATRSDKRLLERLSLSDWDAELGIRPDERAILSAHVPETHRLHSGNMEAMARRKDAFIFKPAQAFAARGFLDSTQVGRSRLRRLLKQDKGYVAQEKVPKSRLQGEGEPPVWTDLRVWAYRGQILLLSGRASSRPGGLDVSPPGGWLPTYVSRRRE